MRKLASLSLGICLLLTLGAPAPAQTPQDEGLALVKKAINAHGGDKVLSAFKAAHIKGKGDVEAGGQKLPFSAEIFSQLPNRFKIVISLDINNMNIEVIQCYDGKKGWMQVNNNTTDMPAEQEKEMKHQMHVSKVLTLVALKDKGYKLSPTGEVKVEDKAALGLLVTKEGERDVTLFFDKATHLLAKAEYRARDEMAGMEVTQEKLFSNYKKLANGYQSYNKMIMRNDGKLLLDMDITEMRVVEKHDDSIFARP